MNLFFPLPPFFAKKQCKKQGLQTILFLTARARLHTSFRHKPVPYYRKRGEPGRKPPPARQRRDHAAVPRAWRTSHGYRGACLDRRPSVSPPPVDMPPPAILLNPPGASRRPASARGPVPRGLIIAPGRPPRPSVSPFAPRLSSPPLLPSSCGTPQALAAPPSPPPRPSAGHPGAPPSRQLFRQQGGIRHKSWHFLFPSLRPCRPLSALLPCFRLWHVFCMDKDMTASGRRPDLFCAENEYPLHLRGIHDILDQRTSGGFSCRSPSD